MLTGITYYPILGKPLIMYLGILTLTSLLLTASIGYATLRGYKWIPFKYHIKLAAVSITLAILHGVLGVLSYFK